MNPWLLSALADSRRQEMEGEAARGPASTLRPGGPPARDAGRSPRVRHRVGLALVEAGLHLLATAPRS
jgi:hypothetical protein